MNNSNPQAQVLGMLQVGSIFELTRKLIPENLQRLLDKEQLSSIFKLTRTLTIESLRASYDKHRSDNKCCLSGIIMAMQDELILSLDKLGDGIKNFKNANNQLINPPEKYVIFWKEQMKAFIRMLFPNLIQTYFLPALKKAFADRQKQSGASDSFINGTMAQLEKNFKAEVLSLQRQGKLADGEAGINICDFSGLIMAMQDNLLLSLDKVGDHIKNLRNGNNQLINPPEKHVIFWKEQMQAFVSMLFPNIIQDALLLSLKGAFTIMYQQIGASEAVIKKAMTQLEAKIKAEVASLQQQGKLADAKVGINIIVGIYNKIAAEYNGDAFKKGMVQNLYKGILQQKGINLDALLRSIPGNRPNQP